MSIYKVCPKFIKEIKEIKEIKNYLLGRLKNILVCRHPSLVFRVHPVGRKKIFCHFEMEKVALIFIYNIFNMFVAKEISFRNEHQKTFLTRTFLVDPVG